MPLHPLRPPSISSAGTFSDICERQAFLDKIVAAPSSEAMERGKCVHAAIEEHMRIRMGEEVERWTGPDPYGAAGYVARLLEWEEYKDLRPRAVELWFCQIPGRMGRPGFWWNGKIDLVSATTPGLDGPCVLDWKTIIAERKIKSPWEAKKSLQLQVYCLVTGVRNAGFVYFTPSGPVKSTIVTFTEQELDKAWLWAYNHSLVIRSRWAALDDDGGNWEEVFSMAAPGHPLCSEKWCDHWDYCFNQEKVDMGSLADAIGQTGKFFTVDEFEQIGTAVYTIRDIETVSMGKEGEKEDKSVLFFVETPKGLVFNKTRIKQLAALFPDKEKDYKNCGDRVTLTLDTVKVNNQNFLMICIQEPQDS